MSKTTGLQEALADQMLALLKVSGARPGYRLREIALSQELKVSRSPIRAALQILVARGFARPSSDRGLELACALDSFDICATQRQMHDEDREIIVALANARATGAIGPDCTQQEIVRTLNAKLPAVLRVLHQLGDLGLVKRRPGFGWSFEPAEYIVLTKGSYAFRKAIEPEALLEPSFCIDPRWIEQMKRRHEALLQKPWDQEVALEFHELNSDFHEDLVGFSGNSYMTVSIRNQVWLRRFLTFHLEYGQNRVHCYIGEHLRILETLSRGDQNLAAELLREHLTTGVGHMPKVFDEDVPPSPRVHKAVATSA